MAGDFLKKDARTPLRASYLAAGVQLRIETNCPSILQTAEESFEQMQVDPGCTDEIRLRLWVEETSRLDEPKSKPYFRGLGHLVFSGFDDRSSLLLNLHHRYGVGRFTTELATDAKFWKTIVFPSLLTILGPSVGLTPLHCACVAWEGSGLLLAGESGSGKSTLSLALAQAGFDFLSDDRTLISERAGRLLAWGLSAEMKQCADAVEHFPVLRDAGSHVWKGEPVFRFDPVETFGVSRAQSCEPRWIVLLERRSEPGFYVSEIAPEEVAVRLRMGLHRETSEIAQWQRRTINSLSERSCRKLSYGGNPHTIAGALRCLIAGSWNPVKPISSPPRRKSVSAETSSSDPLRRFRNTSLCCDVNLMGKGIRLETDNPIVLKQAGHALRLQETVKAPPQFVWRIVCEPREEPDISWPPMTAFCDRSIRYINLGQRGFIAVDLQACEAVGILPENLARDEAGFSSVFLASMLYLSAPALGLMPVSAACVAKGDKGLLLFGPPNSGKTTSSYWARKLGLAFHADQASFLELDAGTVRAWGDFWPAAFRPETAQFLPELSALTRPFSYRDRTFLCMDKTPSCPTNAGSVVPAACIFLERQVGATVPKLIPLSSQDVTRRVTTPFKDDAPPKDGRDAVFQVLSRLPSYRLLYGNDPYVAALFLRSILNTDDLMEARL